VAPSSKSLSWFYTFHSSASLFLHSDQAQNTSSGMQGQEVTSVGVISHCPHFDSFPNAEFSLFFLASKIISKTKFAASTKEAQALIIRGGFQGRRTRWPPRASPFSEMPWGPTFESYALSFCIVLLKRLLTILEPHFISSEASHSFFKIKRKLCENVPKGYSTTLMGGFVAPSWEFASGP